MSRFVAICGRKFKPLCDSCTQLFLRIPLCERERATGLERRVGRGGLLCRQNRFAGELVVVVSMPEEPHMNRVCRILFYLHSSSLSLICLLYCYCFVWLLTSLCVNAAINSWEEAVIFRLDSLEEGDVQLDCVADRVAAPSCLRRRAEQEIGRAPTPTEDRCCPELLVAARSCCHEATLLLSGEGEEGQPRSRDGEAIPQHRR